MADRKIKGWFTTKTGKHIPIFEGESKADVMKRMKDSYSKNADKKADVKRIKEEGKKLKEGKASGKIQTTSTGKKASKETDKSVKSNDKKKAIEQKSRKELASRYREEAKSEKSPNRRAFLEATAKRAESGSMSYKDVEELRASKKDQQIKQASERSNDMNAEERYRDSLKQGNKVTFKRGKTMFKGKEVQALDTKDALQEIRGDEKHAPKDNSLAKHLDKNGNLSEERKKIHAEILQNYFNGVIEAKKDQKPVAHQPYAPGEKKVAMFTGGGGASGKGAFSKDVGKYYSQNNNPMVIDPDALKSVLMKYDFPEKKSIDSELTGWYHEESSALAKQIYATALENDFPVMYDGTATGGGIYKLLDMSRQKGYSPEMNFIFSDWKTVRQNSLDRLEKSGRFVPPEQQLGAHQKAYKAVEALQDKFDSFKLWDNAGRNMKLVGESSGRNKLKISNAESWNRFKTSADDFTLSKEEIDRFYDDADKISKKRKLAGL